MQSRKEEEADIVQTSYETKNPSSVEEASTGFMNASTGFMTTGEIVPFITPSGSRGFNQGDLLPQVPPSGFENERLDVVSVDEAILGTSIPSQAGTSSASNDPTFEAWASSLEAPNSKPTPPVSSETSSPLQDNLVSGKEQDPKPGAASKDSNASPDAPTFTSLWLLMEKAKSEMEMQAAFPQWIRKVKADWRARGHIRRPNLAALTNSEKKVGMTENEDGKDEKQENTDNITSKGKQISGKTPTNGSTPPPLEEPSSSTTLVHSKRQRESIKIPGSKRVRTGLSPPLPLPRIPGSPSFKDIKPPDPAAYLNAEVSLSEREIDVEKSTARLTAAAPKTNPAHSTVLHAQPIAVPARRPPGAPGKAPGSSKPATAMAFATPILAGIPLELLQRITAANLRFEEGKVNFNCGKFDQANRLFSVALAALLGRPSLSMLQDATGGDGASATGLSGRNDLRVLAAAWTLLYCRSLSAFKMDRHRAAAADATEAARVFELRYNRPGAPSPGADEVQYYASALWVRGCSLLERSQYLEACAAMKRSMTIRSGGPLFAPPLPVGSLPTISPGATQSSRRRRHTRRRRNLISHEPDPEPPKRPIETASAALPSPPGVAPTTHASNRRVNQNFSITDAYSRGPRVEGGGGGTFKRHVGYETEHRDWTDAGVDDGRQINERDYEYLQTARGQADPPGAHYYTHLPDASTAPAITTQSVDTGYPIEKRSTYLSEYYQPHSRLEEIPGVIAADRGYPDAGSNVYAEYRDYSGQRYYEDEEEVEYFNGNGERRIFVDGSRTMDDARPRSMGGTAMRIWDERNLNRISPNPPSRLAPSLDWATAPGGSAFRALRTSSGPGGMLPVEESEGKELRAANEQKAAEHETGGAGIFGDAVASPDIMDQEQSSLEILQHAALQQVGPEEKGIHQDNATQEDRYIMERGL